METNNFKQNDSVETLPTSVEVNSNKDLTSDNVKETQVAEGSCSPTSCCLSDGEYREVTLDSGKVLKVGKPITVTTEMMEESLRSTLEISGENAHDKLKEYFTNFDIQPA